VILLPDTNLNAIIFDLVLFLILNNRYLPMDSRTKSALLCFTNVTGTAIVDTTQVWSVRHCYFIPFNNLIAFAEPLSEYSEGGFVVFSGVIYQGRWRIK